jgi:imidazolonepropionase-like amidohydrolase
MTLEEQQAIVDEAHRQGVKVACTARAGIAVRQSIEAGCDSLELGIDIDPESIRMMVENGMFMTFALTANPRPDPRSSANFGGPGQPGPDLRLLKISPARRHRASQSW